MKKISYVFATLFVFVAFCGFFSEAKAMQYCVAYAGTPNETWYASGSCLQGLRCGNNGWYIDKTCDVAAATLDKDIVPKNNSTINDPKADISEFFILLLKNIGAF